MRRLKCCRMARSGEQKIAAVEQMLGKSSRTISDATEKSFDRIHEMDELLSDQSSNIHLLTDQFC